MKCNKRLLVYLIFQALLMISEAGRNSKPKNPMSPFPGSGPGTRGTSSGRTNSGRASSTQTNVRGNQVSGPSHPNRAPVQPASVGALRWFNSQPPATLPLNRPQASGPLDWSKFPFSETAPGSGLQLGPHNSGTGSQVRPYNSGSGPQVGPNHLGSGPPARPHNSVTAPWSRFQTPGTEYSLGPHTPGTALSVRPHDSGASASHEPQTPDHSSPGTSQMGYPHFLINDNYPGLKPKRTDFGAEIGRLDRSSSASSSSLGYHSGSRSSISSISSTKVEPVGLKTPGSTAIMESAAHPSKCVDKTETTPKTIAPAEHCFDYFKFAVAWNPGMAYKLWLTRYKIRTDRIHQS
ncbi:GSCOCT00013035001.2-RA-CDS [Cotesia congregata]|uniref:Cc_RNAseT2.3_25.6b n=1 Tax=Cotesia congregata TaxID=51543 RepID=S6D2S8_COTCN|nr:GSCOCT00013035001.2-RA-CDS [Cotesia congregata]CAG5092328.1 cc_RNAseT2.3_25.6b [Cotesia congregata]CCQ71083.1 hypothetical ribonuclease RNAseT2-like3 [Cotesia congregata]